MFVSIIVCQDTVMPYCYFSVNAVIGSSESSESDKTWTPSSSGTVSDSTNGATASSGEESPRKWGEARLVPSHETGRAKPAIPSHHETPSAHTVTPPRSSVSVNLLIVMLSVLIMILAVIWWLVWPGTAVMTGERIPNNRTSTDEFIKHFQELQQSFPSQTGRFWKTVSSRSRRHLSSMPPKRPLVFMIAADSQTAGTSQCFAQRLGHALGSSKPRLLNGLLFQGANGDDVKLKLDTTLKQYFDNNLAGTVIIDHIELLPPLSPFLFYSYCDNDNAVYPYATIIFVTHMQIDMSRLDHVEAETAVEHFLSKEVWRDNPPYNPSAVAALLSRITDTVLIPKTELLEIC